MNLARKEGVNVDYYGEKGWQAIDFIERYNLDFNLGNVIKYLFRAGKKTKSRVNDLCKAYWYLNRHLNQDQNSIILISNDELNKYVEKGSLEYEYCNIIINALSNNKSALIILGQIITNTIILYSLDN